MLCVMLSKQRRAYICRHKDCVPPLRVFLMDDEKAPPRCPEHGPMKLQANMPQRSMNGRPPRT